MVSLAALRWLADQDAAFVMLDRDGSVLITTDPVRPSDARLRRAQALAHQSGIGLRIARELVDQKLAAQARLASDGLQAPAAAKAILQARLALASADTVDSIRVLESQAAYAYWSAWRNIPVNFPKNDARRVPAHWLTFGTRISPLTGSPRLAVNPANAILNYLYAVLESEARLAVAELGLDPGVGVMHADSRTRDSLACDLMEPVRPQVDAYLLQWITQQPLRREWFFEQRDGNCRLMGSFAKRLSETASTWAGAVAPFAERTSRILWSAVEKTWSGVSPASRLTGSYRRIAKGKPPNPTINQPPPPPAVCRLCGNSILSGHKYCSSCSLTAATQQLAKAAQKGRIASRTPQVLARLGEKQRSHRIAERNWNPGHQPDWLNEAAYVERIQPRLVDVAVSSIALNLGVSLPYASDIRAGRRRPHPRHWLSLARLVGVPPETVNHGS
jgi:CRISPR-associated endonuclease Cas1